MPNCRYARARDGPWLTTLDLAPAILYALYAVIATFLSYRWGFPSAVTWWMPVYVFVSLPIMALSALKFGEAAMDIIKSFPPLVVSLIPGNEKPLENLRKRRAYLAEELNGVIGMFSFAPWTRPARAEC